MRLLILLALGVAFALAPKIAAAQSVIDPDASVVELRASCALPGGTYLDNCFETTADLTDWLWVNAGTASGRSSEPNSLDEVSVRAGPGVFDLFECNSTAGMRGYVSVVGEGRDKTHFVSNSDFVDPTLAFSCAGGVTVRGCTGLSFRNLSARGVGTGAAWTGMDGGASFWEGVDIIGDNEGVERCNRSAMGWYDTDPNGVHFFWNARFEAVGVGTLAQTAFNGRGESWIYGSDLLLKAGGESATGIYATIISGGSNLGVRLFGSTVRATASSDFSGVLVGLDAFGVGGSTIHMHGGIVNVNGPISVSIRADAEAFVHTPGTAFVLPEEPAIAAARIFAPSAAKVQSPFLWPNGTTPPKITSQTGADLFVKTDEGPAQDEAHLLVYDAGCTPDPWRRVADNTCL